MSQQNLDATLDLMRESPFLGLCVLLIVSAYLLASKVAPEVAKKLQADREAALAREARKELERQERAKTEGQWVQLQERANQLQESSNRVIEAANQKNARLLEKLDRDAEQAQRLETKVDSMTALVVRLNERLERR